MRLMKIMYGTVCLILTFFIVIEGKFEQLPNAIVIFIIPVVVVSIIEFFLTASLSKKTDELDIIYYRDIPEKYSPVIASIIDNNKIEIRKDITALLLHLEYKGYIKINGDKVKVTGKDYSCLTNHEKYVINTIIYEEEFNFSRFKKLANEDAISMGYMVKKFFRIPSYGEILFIIITFILPYILAAGRTITTLHNYQFFVPFFALGAIVYYRVENITVCNKEGIIEREKIRKFKYFMKHFSDLKNRSKEEIVLWQNYLIYAVCLNINKKKMIDKDILNKFDNEHIVSFNVLLNYVKSKFNTDK